MKSMKNRSFTIFIYFLFIGNCILLQDCSSDTENTTTETETTNISSPEWNINLGSDTTIPFFPDGQSNYFTYAFLRSNDDNISITLEGTFPEARYMSVVVYDNDSRDPIAILKDVDIAADLNSENPFTTQNYSADQKYTITIAPNAIQSTAPNLLEFDDSKTNLSIFIRYYVPETNSLGGVDLPEIKAYNNGNLVAPYENLDLEQLVNFDDIVATLQLLNTTLFTLEEDERLFVRANSSTSGNYANPDNDYLISAATLEENEVILIRWKAPSVSTNFSDFSNFNTRYYSVGISSPESYNFHTSFDEDLYIAIDGFINLVIARPDSEIIDQSAGLNFIAWPDELDNRGIILYRNLVSSPLFLQSISNCPTISGNFSDFLSNPFSYNANNYINEFAPTGLKMTKSEFLSNFGGINVSY